MTYSGDDISVQPRSNRPLPWLSWWFSAIFAIALVALVLTIGFSQSTSADQINLKIVDHASGDAVAGAEVRIGDSVWRSDSSGTVSLPAEVEQSAIHIQRQGFDEWYSDIGLDKIGSMTVELQTSASSESTPSPETPKQSIGATPPPASTAVPGVADATAAASPDAAVQLDGKVTDSTGKGIQGARIVISGVVDVTGKDGLFSLDVPGQSTMSFVASVIASGYLEQDVEISPEGAPLDVVLEPHKIKAIYLNPNIATADADIDRLIDMIDTTELNAVVIDIKEELIYYDSKVPFFMEAETVRPRFDIEEMLAKFKDHGIYTIARLVVFKDSIVAENRPELAVTNNQTGDLWRDMNGVAWVNPMSHELWEANTDLAKEAAEHGFDEIQFDYVRFPTDGDLTTMDFGLENTQEVRERSIEKFLEMADQKVHPTGAKLSADVFGYTMLVDDDLGIGQNFPQLAEYVDYLSPMVYPSHFPDGSIAVDGQPNDFPYETIEISVRLGREKLGGDASKIRPWLQDFSFFDMTPYGDKEVRAQIDATNDVGTSGWMLWDPNNVYHPGALEKEDGSPAGTPAATLPAPPSASPPPTGTPVTKRRLRRR